MSLTHYTIIVGYRFLEYSTQAFIAFIVIKLLSNLNIKSPFNANALKLMQKITYCLLLLCAIVESHNFHLGIFEPSAIISV